MHTKLDTYRGDALVSAEVEGFDWEGLDAGEVLLFLFCQNA